MKAEAEVALPSDRTGRAPDIGDAIARAEREAIAELRDAGASGPVETVAFAGQETVKVLAVGREGAS